MQMRLLLVAATTLLAGAVAQAQVRITSLSSNGTLVWTNSVARGAYSVQGANSPLGPWTPFASVIDTNTATTNPITAQIPVTNSQGYFRVGWTIPNPVGVWDYQANDSQGTLIVTGQLTITSATLSPSSIYNLLGNYDLQYAGPPTNNLWYLGPHIGSNALTGTFSPSGSSMIIRWPQNYFDYNITLTRDIWANTYTGQWLFVTQAPVGWGTFSATKR